MDDLDLITHKRIQKVRSATWLSFTNLCYHCGFDETKMRELTQRKDFPRPASPTETERGKRWNKDEVNEWMAAHKLEAIGDV